jgi:hypothetical protein
MAVKVADPANAAPPSTAQTKLMTNRACVTLTPLRVLRRKAADS